MGAASLCLFGRILHLDLLEAFCSNRSARATRVAPDLGGAKMTGSTDGITLGITKDKVPLGSHLIHFWEDSEEFERGVRFLELGIESDAEYCVLFGHDEANRRVLEILHKRFDDLDRVIREERLVILRRESSAPTTLARIESAFEAALRKGASAIRYLGNLGMGKAPLPARGADEVIALENGASALGLRFPCVIVCMYDINTVSGRLVLNAGFGTHPFSVCGHSLRENSYFTANPRVLKVQRSAQ